MNERKTATVEQAIAAAEAILPGVEAAEGEEDPRWQAIIEVGNYIDSDPEQVWQFIERWGGHEDWDLRAAIATCLLEELLADNFQPFFSRVEERARSEPLFANMFLICAQMGESEAPGNAERYEALRTYARDRD